MLDLCISNSFKFNFQVMSLFHFRTFNTLTGNVNKVIILFINLSAKHEKIFKIFQKYCEIS